MSEPPIYGNLEEIPIEDSPIYGNLEDFTNIYSDDDFEAAAARIDLPALPPKPQKRASWFQAKSSKNKNETTKDIQTDKCKKPKKKVTRKKKEAPSLPSPVEKPIPLNPSSPNPSSSNPSLPKRTSSKTQPVKPNRSRTCIKCLFILLFIFLLLAGAGVVVYFQYGEQILCFIGYGSCSDNRENTSFNKTTVRVIEERSTTEFVLTTDQEIGMAVWSNWKDWGKCSASCGRGLQNRFRECKHLTLDCSAEGSKGIETRPCNQKKCPVDGEWLDWQEWGICSKSCGSGIRKRTRKCTTPKFGGKPCASEGLQTYEEEERCNIKRCKDCGSQGKRFENNCYRLIKETLNWGESKKFCQNLTSHLVSIHTKDVMEFLKREVLLGHKENTWIGGYEFDGMWKWEDGSEFDGTYSNWAPDQPNGRYNDIVDCAYLYEDVQFKWADAECDHSMSFICMF